MDPIKLAKSFMSESGAQLVEFALSVPVLLLITMGIIDFGLAFQRYEVLTNAAREGARVGVLTAYGPEDIEARVVQYLTGTDLAATAVTTVGPAEPLVISAGRCISVRPVSVSFDHQFLFVGGLMNYFGSSLGTRTLVATSSMRSEIGAVSCP